MAITDVPGVRVAHVTLGGGETGGAGGEAGEGGAGTDDVRTGVTCVLPHHRDLLEEPVTAAAHVVNGYGKPVGLTQWPSWGRSRPLWC